MSIKNLHRYTNKKTCKSKLSRKLSKKIPIIFVKPYYTDEFLKNKEGHYFSDKHFNKIIQSDCDVYINDDNSKHPKKCPNKLLFKFRKNVIPKKTCVKAFHSMYQASQKKNRNRGAASGIINVNKLPKYAKNISHVDKYRVFYKNKFGTKKKDNIGNTAMSNIIGYYDKPDRNVISNKLVNGRIPKSKMCRTTAFTKNEIDKWIDCLPIIMSADSQFKKLIPDKHKKQLYRCKKTPNYQINNSAFSTITLNYNWRTASHIDKGDYTDGFGNLLVLEKDKCHNNNNTNNYNANVNNPINSYKGGYLGFPKYKIAVDVRQGDFLAMDVHQYHCNTPLKSILNNNNKINKLKINTTKKKLRRMNKYSKIDDNHGRLSIVCYLRKNMIKCQ